MWFLIVLLGSDAALAGHGSLHMERGRALFWAGQCFEVLQGLQP